MTLVRRSTPVLLLLALLCAAIPAADAAARDVRGVLVHRTAEGVVVSQRGDLVTLVGARARGIGRTVVAVASPRGDGTYAARSLRVLRTRTRTAAVRTVRLAGTVTFASRVRHRYTLSAGGASLAVVVGPRTRTLPAVGTRVGVTVSLRADGRLKERHRSAGGRSATALLSGRVLGVAPAGDDWALFVSADDAGRTRSAVRVVVPDGELPSFVRSGARSIRAAYDWSARTVVLDRPPRAWASGPQVLVTLAVGRGPADTLRATAVRTLRSARAPQRRSSSGAPGSGGSGAAGGGPGGLPSTSGTGGTTPPGIGGTTPPVSPLRPYAAASPWNTPVPAGVTVDPRSASYIRAISDNALPLTTDVDQYTIPVYTFDAATPRRTVRLDGYFSAYDAGDDSRVGFGEAPTITNVPVPANAQASEGSDGQIVIYDAASHTEYSFWQWARDASGNLTATNGYRYHTSSEYHGRFADGLAGRGAGLPYFAGLVRPWEIERGRIDHALAFAYESPAPSFVYPASKSDGDGVAGVDVPEGARLQLDPSLTDADFAAWGLSAPARTIARALQAYGMYVVDNSGSSKVYLEDRKTAVWGPEITRDLVAGIPWTAFRVVAPPAGG